MKLTPIPFLKKRGFDLNLMQFAKLGVAPLFFKRGIGGEFKRIKFYFAE